MDTAKYLRFQTRVVGNEEKQLVSPGAAFRWRKQRDAARRRLERRIDRHKLT
jgi:hypothetical protein